MQDKTLKFAAIMKLSVKRRRECTISKGCDLGGGLGGKGVLHDTNIDCTISGYWQQLQTY